MAVVVVLRVTDDGLRRGEIIGWVDVVTTGGRYTVRNAWELVEVLRRVEGELRARPR